MEDWIPLEEYPGYSVSTEGRVRNDDRDKVLAAVRTISGHTFVGLVKNGVQVKRGLAKLVSTAFIPNNRKHFTTPIHLDGDLGNCRVSNMMWRPRWFAMAFTQQFHINQPIHPAIRDRETGEVYEDGWYLVSRDGLLYRDIIGAIVNRSYVFPTMAFYEWVE